MYFYNLEKTPYRIKREGVEFKSISGELCQMILVRLAPGFVTDRRHPEEQIGLVVSGTNSLTVEGESRTGEPGHGYRIPAGCGTRSRSHRTMERSSSTSSAPRRKRIHERIERKKGTMSPGYMLMGAVPVEPAPICIMLIIDEGMLSRT